MDKKVKAGSCEKYVVAAVAMSCLSNLLMTEWIKGHSEGDLDEFARAVERKIKNATIEGLDYDQQEALVRRSVAYASQFLNVFREKLRDKA